MSTTTELRRLNDKGFSLTELIVVMAIFIVIIIITADAFQNIYAMSRQQGKLAESNIEGMVGLELLRSDLAHAGFGLPFVFNNLSTLSYNEADVATDFPAKGVSANALNDTPRAPRPLVVRTTTSYVNGNSGTGPDYLTVKSTMVGMNDTAKKWTYMVYSSSSLGTNDSYIKSRGSISLDLANTDRIISISNIFASNGEAKRNLLTSGATFYTTPGSIVDAFKPSDASQQVTAYGIGTTNPRMPFNRADFYINRPGDTPASCNAGTGVLYKGALVHSSGGFTQYPLLNCVADMKVIYQLDMDDDGSAGTFVNASAVAGNVRMGTESTSDAAVADTLARASLLRKRLKEVRVYILAQDGQKDKSYTYPVSDVNKAIIVGETAIESVSRVWTQTDLAAAFGSDWRNYRWRVYMMAVRPNSLY